MRNSIVSWAAAAAIALGVPVVASICGERRKRHEICATQWKEAQGAGTTGGQTLAPVSGAMPCEPERRRGGASVGPGARPVWLSDPMVAAVGASFRAGVERRRRDRGSKRHETMREPMERRPRRRERPAARPGRSFWRNAVRAVQPRPRPRAVSLRRRPLPQRPPLSRARCSHGGSRRPTRRRRTSALLRPCERASTRPSFRRVRPARQTRSCGSTRRRASTTIREPTITGTHAGAPICAKPMRGRADFARRGIANVRPRRLRAEGAAHGRRRALTEQLVSGHRLFPPIGLTASFDARAAALFTDEIRPAERTRRVVIERQNYRRRCVTRLTVRHAQFMPNSLSPR